MQIIIPLAGKGSRFKDDGYELPKPLIKVLGDPLIFHVLRSLQIKEGDKIHIPYSVELDKFGFKGIVLKEFPDVNLIPLNYPTRGAVETVLCALQQIENLNERVLICDGDTFYVGDTVARTIISESGNAIFYFRSLAEEPIYSYIKIGDGMEVIEVKEKEKISDFACTGAYLFKSGGFLKEKCQSALANETKSKGEFYISDIFRLMAIGGEKIDAIVVENFYCLGTPNQLKAYCMSCEPKFTSGVSKRFCFDLDGTLCTFPPIKNGYFGVKPIEKNIKKLKHLHSLGHTIIIQTARGMGSNLGNAGAAVAKAQAGVFWFLKEHDIPFDEIYFGKPQANFYIDDLAVSAYDDLDKALGFYDGTVEPRHFNKVEIGEICVRKECANPGEIYWYENIPESIAIHFPQAVMDTMNHKENQITIKRINGVPLSYLFVNGSLTKADIDLLLATMDKIHNSEFTPGNIDLYGNYSKKLNERSVKISLPLEEWVPQAKFINDKLLVYQKDDLAIKGICHGDPVFTNIFLCEGRLLKFIDMRGMVGEEKTIYGDIMYDYAKIYQSLNGYDHILTGAEPNESYQKELKEYFELKFIEKFPKYFDWLKLITASHFLTLIPLHTDYDKQIKYLELMKKLIA